MSIGWETAVEGLVVGVASGLVLSGFFCLMDKRKSLAERRDQIRYLARLIASERENMLNLDNALGGESKADDEGASITRRASYEAMRQRVEAALGGGSSRLSFDEINQVRSALRDHTYLSKDLARRFLVGGKAYNIMFRELESIDWLKLTKGPYFPESGDRGSDVD